MPVLKRPILALDAAFGQASACLIAAGGESSFHATGEGSLPHSQAILPLLEGLLRQAGVDWQDLEMLAIGIGPGSFTGLRVAAASMAGINAVLKRPLLTVSSLAITACQSDAEKVWVIEDARSGDAYIGHYMAGKAVQPDRCLAWDHVIELPITSYATLSDTTSNLPLAARPLPLVRSRPEALERVIGMVLGDSQGAETARYPIPAYIRPSQAERNARPS